MQQHVHHTNTNNTAPYCATHTSQTNITRPHAASHHTHTVTTHHTTSHNATQQHNITEQHTPTHNNNNPYHHKLIHQNTHQHTQAHTNKNTQRNVRCKFWPPNGLPSRRVGRYFLLIKLCFVATCWQSVGPRGGPKEGEKL